MATPGPLGPNLQGMDSLTAAMKTNIIPDQEYLLQVVVTAIFKNAFNLVHLNICLNGLLFVGL